MTRLAWSWDIFASYILALLMGFSFTVLPCSADNVQQSHQCTLSVQICGRDTFYEQHTGKKKGNRKSIYWKMSDKNCHEVPRKILNLLLDEIFCISKNMALSYVFLDESHVFSFLNKSFSMQIKNFSWGLSSDKKNFLKKKWYFYPHIDTVYTINVIPMIFPCKFSTKLHIHMFWVAQWRRLIDLST